MDLEALALAVDERVRVPAAERSFGRLYAVRCDAAADNPTGGPGASDENPAGGPGTGRDNPAGSPGTDDDYDGDDDGGGHDGGGQGAHANRGVVLELLAEGEARSLPQKVRPPSGAQAIALASGVWAAPMEEEGSSRPPSQHPERRRAHLTVVVGAEGGHDGVDVSVLRYSDGSPTVLRGGVGLLHQRLLRCWSRRPDAPWAGQRSKPAA